MADQELVDLLKQGVKQWNEWCTQHQGIEPDLTGANLSEANLDNAILASANLSHANLANANLYHAILACANLSYTNLSHTILGPVNLRYANLTEANLSGVSLIEADLSGADLSFADLSGVNLEVANLNEANLNNTNLSRVIMSETIIANVDLRVTKGLAEIVHRRPSPVALYSVQLPQDGSALHFLRGAGVPDEWIDDYRARMMQSIQYHSCFISYSNKDEVVARRLHADLQDHGIRCWFAPEDLKIGDKMRKRIDEAIHLHEKLLLLLSENAIKSNWVEDEVEAALEKEQRQQRDVLFPIRLDNVVMETSQAWAAKLRRQRHIGDFTQWTEPQAYEQAFERLLRDLKKATNELGNNEELPA